MSEAFIPKTLDEALQIMTDKEVLPIAGGTDLMVQHRREGGISPKFEQPLLFLDKIELLKKIEINSGKLILGAGVLLKDLVNDSRIPYILKDTTRQMAAVTTRNVATIGGNVSNTSPAADTLPFLYLMNATLVLKSAKKEREVPVSKFVTGPGQSCMKPNELLLEIRIPRENFHVEYYRKVGTRKAMALSKLSFAGVASFDENKLKDFRIALGAVAPKIVRERDLENKLIGLSKSAIEKKMPELRESYSKYIQPIDDARSTKEYRKMVSLDMIDAFIENKILGSEHLKSGV